MNSPHPSHIVPSSIISAISPMTAHPREELVACLVVIVVDVAVADMIMRLFDHPGFCVEQERIFNPDRVERLGKRRAQRERRLIVFPGADRVNEKDQRIAVERNDQRVRIGAGMKLSVVFVEVDAGAISRRRRRDKKIDRLRSRDSFYPARLRTLARRLMA